MFDVLSVVATDAVSAVVKLAQEIDESCVVAVRYGMVSPLSPRPADCGKLCIFPGERWLQAGTERRCQVHVGSLHEARVEIDEFGSRDKLWRARLSLPRLS